MVEFEEDAFDEEDGGVKSLDICLGEGCLVGGLEVELEGVTLDEVWDCAFVGSVEIESEEDALEDVLKNDKMEFGLRFFGGLGFEEELVDKTSLFLSFPFIITAKK